jgi:HK97 family phage portal protein
MKIFGFEINLRKTLPALPAALDPTRWWWPVINEPFTGAWQSNQELRFESLMSHTAIYRCITMISSDIAKMRIKLVENVGNDIWVPIDSAAFTPVLRKPNDFQTRIQFFEDWMRSKLMSGNTYVLKNRDQRGVVTRLYVLNPHRVKVYVAPDGDVFYQLHGDELLGLYESEVAVPASEIIHDRYNPLYHPLCGIPPLSACALAGALGLSIQRNSANFFQNASVPGGILTAPHTIDQVTADRLKTHWESNYTGDKRGRVAVLGDGLKFEVMRETAVDAQLSEQLKLSSEIICMAFGVPPYMIGAAPPPNFNNIEALNQQYYAQCLQVLIESIEILLDEGLGLVDIIGKSYGVEFCVGDLIRMDTPTKVKAWTDMIQGGIAAPNEARAAFDLEPVTGGDSVYLQQQNYSLEALAKRDSQDDPFGTNTPAPTEEDPEEEEESDEPATESSGARSIEDVTKIWVLRSGQFSGSGV